MDQRALAALSDMTQPPLSPDDLRFLEEAAQYLEFPRFLMRVANLVGKPAEGLLVMLPARVHSVATDVTEWALTQALRAGVYSLSAHDWRLVGRWLKLAGPRSHAALSVATGTIGGLFGLPGAVVEIPFTTTLMLRSIAQIAEQSGADLNDPETLMQCLAVFSYGSPPRMTADDKTNQTQTLGAMEASYFTMRVGIARQVERAAAFVAQHTTEQIAKALKNGTAPAMVQLINKIAARFQIEVTEKLAAQAVPVVGAATGALINAAFTDHFNRVAQFHFGIVRLERQYGREAVQAAYRDASERAKRTAST